MKVVVAIDSFKGSLSSAEAGNAVKAGVLSAIPDARVIVKPLADGGEGTVAALTRALNGRWKSVRVNDPLGRPVSAIYGIAGETAILEMSSASGMSLLKREELNPMRTSTFGTGELILSALKDGAERAERLACKTLAKVYKKVGLLPRRRG